MTALPKSAVKRISDRKHVNILVLMCAVVYFTSYLTRVNYKAVISEIVNKEGISNATASVALTGLFITYGVGQLISGWLGDRIKPRYIMTGGMIIASTMNILLPLNSDPVYMTVIWCVNGFGQAMMWPPIVKTLTNHLSSENYLDASVKVSWGSAAGSIAVYLISPLIIAVSSWHFVFYVCAALGLCGAALTFFGLRRMETYAEEHGEIPAEEQIPASEKGAKDHLSLPRYFYPLLGMILLAIVLQGSLRDGIDTWLPTYLNDNFNVSGVLSILTAVVIPIFALVSYQITKQIYNRFFKNEMLCSAVIFGFGLFFLILLSAVSRLNPVLSVVCFTCGVGSMHAVNLVLITFVPRRFKKYGNISTMSGILNFATYVGSALSTYVFANLIDGVGWTGTILTWVALGAAGTVCCLVSIKPWDRFTK